MQDKTGNTGKVSQIYLKLDDPANTRTTSVEYLKKLRAWRIIRSTHGGVHLRAQRQQHSRLKRFIIVIMGIGVVIGFAVVCLSMYMAVLQRTREIGILKSLGGSKGFILGDI